MATIGSHSTFERGMAEGVRPPVPSVDLRTVPTREQVAATRIQSAWRHSREGIDLVRTREEVLSRLPHTEFTQTWTDHIEPLLRRGLANPQRRSIVETVVKNLLVNREIQQSNMSLLCTSIKGRGSLPEYRLVESSAIDPSWRRVGQIYLTPGAQHQYLHMPKSDPLTKRQLDALVSELSKQLNLFPWSYAEDGCFARTRLLVDLLALSGISKRHISKQYALIPKRFRGKHQWLYHVTASVKLSDGSSSIVDPVFSSKRGLNLTSWINKQKRQASQAMPMRDMGHMVASASGTKEIASTNYECLAFSTGSEAVLEDLDASGRKFGLKTMATDQQPGVQTLAYCRSRLEERLVDSFLEDSR